MNPAQPTFLLDSYRFSWPEDGIEILVDRLREHRGELQCEMSVRTTIPPYAGLLRQANFNLSAARPRTEWANDLGRRIDLDWHDVIEQACVLSLRRWREGEPIVDLTEVEPRQKEAFLLPPFIVEGAASGIFADGGTGKSLFALAAALSVATGEAILGVYPERLCPVLYLDWEWDAEAHAERLQALCAGAGIDPPKEMIWYRHELASALESAPTVRQLIGQHGIGLVVVDSLGFARGGEPESAELTIKLFATFRTYGVPVLFVDHVAKHSTDRQHSFGSVYTRNSARLMWRIDAQDEVIGSSRLLGLVNTKSNLRLQRPRGLRLLIGADDDGRLQTVRFESCDPLSMVGFEKSLTLRDQLIRIIKANGPGEVEDLRARLLGLDVKASTSTIRGKLGTFKGVFAHGESGWGLLENRVAGLDEGDPVDRSGSL